MRPGIFEEANLPAPRRCKAVDRMVECASGADADIAGFAREAEIDIAVDLKGYTRNARPGIFAFRPAPIQVSYLGYPGTMGTDGIDYSIADSTLIPISEESAYDEKVVYIPHSYQVNDSTAYRAMWMRHQAGLPPDRIVVARCECEA
jgi:predicted O-linked N-acetylglucosamine transferase (SPINDLY family)